jgi:hypothetical protein
MTRPIAHVDVPLPVLTLQLATLPTYRPAKEA